MPYISTLYFLYIDFRSTKVEDSFSSREGG
jgi:hypothetical protein